MPDIPFPPDTPMPGTGDNAGQILPITQEQISAQFAALEAASRAARQAADEQAASQHLSPAQENMAIMEQMYTQGTEAQRQKILQQQLQTEEAMAAANAEMNNPQALTQAMEQTAGKKLLQSQ